MPSKPQHNLLWIRKPMKNMEKPFAGKCLFFPRLHSAADRNQTAQTGVLWSHLVWRDKQFGGSSEGRVGGE